MSTAKNLLIQVFAKSPDLGWAKSRIARDYGNPLAASLQEALLEVLVEQLSKIEIPIQFWIATPDRKEPDFPLVSSLFSPPFLAPKESLEENLIHAANWAWKNGFTKSLFLGVDSPCPLNDQLHRALSALEERDAVIGPAEDGGVYLLGLSGIDSDFWREVPWETDQVCKEIRNALRKRKVNAVNLPTGWDVDQKKDLLRLKKAWKKESGALSELLQELPQ